MIPKIKILKKIPGEIILLHIHVYHKCRSYDIWFLKYKVPQTEIFFHFGPFFCPFSPLTTWKTKILKLKNTPGHIILQICTTKDNHMMYDSWDMDSNRQNFLSKFWKNEKHIWGCYYLTNVYHKWKSYDLWFLRYRVQQTKN